MIIRRCIECKNIKYIVNDTGECPTCIGDNLTELEKNVLHYIYKTNGSKTNVTKLKSIVSESKISPKIYGSSMYDDYDIVDLNKKCKYRGIDKLEVILNDDIPVEQIIEDKISNNQ